MKRNAIVSALVAMSLSIGGPAFAQGDGDQQAQRRAQRQYQRAANPQQSQRANQQQRQRGYQQPGQRGYQQPGQRGYEQQAQRGDQRHDERGAGPDRNFHRGDRLPPQYRGRYYVVDDWRGHHLSPPPRGYHWVQTGGDYVLVAIATGIILQLLLNN